MKGNQRRPKRSAHIRAPVNRSEVRAGVRDQDVCIALGKWVLSNLQPLFDDLRFRLVPIKCAADRFSLSPLHSFTDRGVFYDDLEIALRDGEIDFSINCLEEIHLPDNEFVRTVAYTSRMDSRDLIVLRQGRSVSELTSGSTIGCYSERQRFQMNRFMPDMRYRYTGGHVMDRLDKLVDGEYDALLVAASDIVRLNPSKHDLTYQPISLDLMIPPTGRGIACIRVPRARSGMAELLETALDDPISRACFAIEMLVETALGEPFNDAVGAHCEVRENRLFLRAFNGMGDRTDPLSVQAAVTREDSLAPDPALLEICVQQLLGQVALIGAGPGRADFMTLRGRDKLNSADVIIYDSRKMDSVLTLASPNSERLYLGPDLNDFMSRPTETPVEVLLREARLGRSIARLYEGDPLLTQPGFFEAMELEKFGVRYEIVPGVTELTSVPAYMGFALQPSDRQGGLYIFTGKPKNMQNLDFSSSAGKHETLIFYHAVIELPDIVAELTRAGILPDTPATVVSHSTLPDQRSIYGAVSNIAQLAVTENMPPDATLIVGASVQPNRRLSWWPPVGALSGKSVALVFSRPAPSDRIPLLEGVETLGGRAVVMDLLKTKMDGRFSEAIDRAMNAILNPATGLINRRSWIVLTSVHGVKALSDSLTRISADLRRLNHTRFAALNQIVAEELTAVGFAADYVPERQSPEMMRRGLSNLLKTKDQVIIIRGSRSVSDLSAGLRTSGVNVMDVAAYQTMPELPNRESLQRILRQTDYMTFDSTGGVLCFLDALRKAGLSTDDVWQNNLKLFAKGRATALTIDKHGLPLANEGGSLDVIDLLSSMADYARREGDVERI